jgi:hypothetical protein
MAQYLILDARPPSHNGRPQTPFTCTLCLCPKIPSRFWQTIVAFSFQKSMLPSATTLVGVDAKHGTPIPLADRSDGTDFKQALCGLQTSHCRWTLLLLEPSPLKARNIRTFPLAASCCLARASGYSPPLSPSEHRY